MTYIDRLNEFWQFAKAKSLSSNQIALYLALLHINNECYWIEWFSVANSTLESTAGINISTSYAIKNQLKQLGLIDYQKTGGRNAPKYKIIELSFSNIRKPAEIKRQSTRKPTATIIDIDMEKDKDNKSGGCALPSRFIIPTLDQIQDYCKDNNISIDSQRFFDYYETRGWKLSHGRRMENWQASIRSWKGRERDFAKAGDNKPDKNGYIKSGTTYSNQDLFDVYE